MATPWLRRIRRTGELKVFCPANAWSAEVTKAISTFNGLSLGCQLAVVNEERTADIIVKLCIGKRDKNRKLVKDQSFTIAHANGTINSPSRFTSDMFGGMTRMLIDDRKREVIAAGVFLPGDYANLTTDQKEMIVVHEFIHSTGMDEHDVRGLMYDSFQVSGNGVLELLPEQGAQPMPPVRLGGMTRCRVALAWRADAREADVNSDNACPTP